MLDHGERLVRKAQTGNPCHRPQATDHRPHIRTHTTSWGLTLTQGSEVSRLQWLGFQDLVACQCPGGPCQGSCTCVGITCTVYLFLSLLCVLSWRSPAGCHIMKS